MSAPPDPDDAVRAWAAAQAATAAAPGGPPAARAPRSVADLDPQLLHSFQASRNRADVAGGVRGLAVLRAPDGGVAVVTGCRDGSAAMWEPVSGRRLHDFSQDSGRIDGVAAIATAGGESLIALGDGTGRIRLHDPSTGVLRRTIDTHRSGVTDAAVATAPDGSLLLATVSARGDGELWDVATSSVLRSFQAGPGTLFRVDIGVLADGAVAIALGTTITVRVLAAESGRPLCEVQADGQNVTRFVAAADGTPRLIVAGSQPELRVFDPLTGEGIQRLPSAGFLTDADFPRRWRSAPFFVTVGDHGRIDLVDPDTARSFRHADGPTEAYWSARLAELEDGRLLLIAGRIDGLVDVWSMLGPAQAATGADRRVEVLRDFSIPGHLDGDTGTVLLPGPGGAPLLATATSDTVRIWAPERGGEPIRTLPTGGWFLGAAATLLPDGTAAVICCENERAARVWHPLTGECLVTVDDAPITGFSAAFATLPDGTSILDVTVTGGVGRWRVADGVAEPIADPAPDLSGRQMPFSISAVQRRGGSLVSAVDVTDGVVLYDLLTRERLQHYAAPGVMSVALCELRDGGTLIAAVRTSGVTIWTVESGARLPLELAASNGSIRLAPLPDGGALLLTESSGEAVLYDAITGDRLHVLGATSLQRYNSIERFGLFVQPDGTVWTSHPRGDDVIVTVLRLGAGTSAPGGGAGRRRGPDRAIVAERFVLLAGAGLAAPFGVVEDLTHLIGAGEGAGALEGLTGHPGFQRLRGLGWPLAARVGLAALLLQDAPPDARLAAPDVDLGRLRSALLAAIERPPAGAAAPVPTAALVAAAQAVTEQTLALLTLLGPDAVAADPVLPLRLRRQAEDLPALGAVARTAITELPRQVEAECDAHAVSVRAGAATAGLRRHGPPRNLLRSQLALPPRLFDWLQARGGLLYRLHEGEPQIMVEPLAIVLDTTPPTFGPVEATLRLLAYGLAHAVLRERQEAALVTLDRPDRLAPLRDPEDLMGLWTTRCYDPPDLGEALTTAASAGLPATVVLTTHHVARHHRLTPRRDLRVATTHAPGERPRPATSGPYGVHLAPRAGAPDVARAVAELLTAGTADGGH